MQPGLTRARIVVDGQEIVRHIMLHAYGNPRNFNIMEPLYLERGIQHTAQIGQATVRLIHARRMIEITAQALRANHHLLRDM
jgi:aminoglycoside N3'-acetyltransferase